MKAFLAGCIGIVLISVVAVVALEQLGMTSENVFSTPNVRLGE